MIDEFLKKLPKNVDGALIVSPENRQYFTGFNASDGFLFATKNGSIFLTDSRYIEAAKDKINCCEVEEQKRGRICQTIRHQSPCCRGGQTDRYSA